MTGNSRFATLSYDASHRAQSSNLRVAFEVAARRALLFPATTIATRVPGAHVTLISPSLLRENLPGWSRSHTHCPGVNGA